MKKQLQIKRIDEELVVMEEESKLFSISKDHSVTGKDLYDFIFKSVPINEQVEINVIGKEHLTGNDKIIFDRFKGLIEKICTAINNANEQSSASENNNSDASARLK